MLRIGPSGNSLGFYERGYKHTYESAQWLAEIGLTAFEYSFGRGVRISDEAAHKIASEMKKYDIALSVHAPYYTNFANPDPEMINNSIGYIRSSLLAMREMGGTRAVFHPASVGKVTRAEAVAVTARNIAKLMEDLDKTLGFTDFILCPETMGKLGQIGTVEEIVGFCKLDPRLYPCYDFGHINSYSQGGLKSEDDYRRIIDYTFSQLGDEKTVNMHVHFSKIQYGQSGEIRHLTLADNEYGPDYEPFAKLVDEYRLSPTIICESRDVMAEDAIIMKKYHKIV